MKFKELQTKSEAELKKLLSDLKDEVHDLSVKKKLNQLKNTHKINLVKKDIARLLTYLSNKS